MDTEISKPLDRTDLLILNALQENARLSFKELGYLVNLSSPAAAERVHRLEETGLILGYQAVIPPEKVGCPIQVFIRLRTTSEKYPKILAVVETLPEILECHHVTGDDSFVMKAAVSSMERLEDLIARISPFGETSTAIVMSSPLKRLLRL